MADTTLSEYYPSNNLGGMTFANSGTTQGFTRNRALFRFDIAAALPPGAVVSSASLTIEVTRQPVDGFAFADFGLHRLLRNWGEGTGITPSGSNSPGAGSPAGTNEACWLTPLAHTGQSWAAPGGAAGIDFIAQPCSLATIYDVGSSPYVFASTPGMVADVQSWLDHPGQNFGWMLLCAAEATDFTARRFGSRENLAFAPVLSLEYALPPELAISKHSPSGVIVQFNVPAGESWALQSKPALQPGPWEEIIAFPADTDLRTVSFTNTATAGGLFRAVRK